MVDDRKQGGEELHHKVEPPKSDIAKRASPAAGLAAREEEVLAFWDEHKIFERSLGKPSPKGEYVFYDGPPFATGLPHYGHLLQSAIKDAIPRYRTMQGYHVPRVWGWDCHGLPLENQIEQELGFKNKRDIETYGIEKFNLATRNAVLRYTGEWKRIIPRIGRWADMENDYKTMDASYTESVWWAFKNLYDRGLAYEGFKGMQLCPRCGTTLSNFEVAQGYKDIEDWAVYVKLPLVDEPNTSLLVWTTTPWTLPGNVAAAVNADATYVKVKMGDEYVVLAKDLAEKVLLKSPGGGVPKFSAEENFGDKDFLKELSPEAIVAEIKGKDLVGKRYEPPFDYFKDDVHKHKNRAWRVYAAPYVTLTDGTGIVHLAPAYGAEDLEFAQKEKIPLIHHVTDEGKFIVTVKDFAGLPVKPKGRHLETDTKIVEWLGQNGKLFKAEKIVHSYPHCWRCDTPLLNWAANSWFVNVQKVKGKLIAANSKVRWVPEHVGSGRFNNLLHNAPDWAISRSRYWGAPLPVWRHSKTKEIKVVGSVEELLALVRKSGNRYFVMRHGHARSNAEARLDSAGDADNHITERGRADVTDTAQKMLQRAKIDLIVISPLLRARETAALVQKELGLPDSAVMVDERLAERNLGTYDGKLITEWEAHFLSLREQFERAPDGAETFTQVRRRVAEFLFEVERRYTGRNILIVTHGDPSWALMEAAQGTSYNTLVNLEQKRGYLKTGEAREIPFIPYPHNAQFELDLHRPYIDEVAMGDTLAGEWKRVPDVFDCWFESGSMPFASNHYPFENKDTFNPKNLFGFMPKGYPADFIAESIDQTRGWFYSMIVLGVALFGKSSYKAVVTNGLVLAEDGRKMSKKLKNYPDPMELVERFGADAVRYYLLSSSVIRGEDLRFSARGVEEVAKKLLMRLDNVRSFYELYALQNPPEKSPGGGVPSRRLRRDGVKDFFPEDSVQQHVLDKWIVSRLNQLVQDVTAGFESYELDLATRPLGEFIDDLSTWYVRRSRERFKTDGQEKDEALATLRHVLYTTAHVMAPVMPFFAEHLYQSVKGEQDAESVHLCDWPVAGAVDQEVLANMRHVRNFAAMALMQREKAGIKIRQPLSKLTIKHDGQPLAQEYCDILADEINVKEIEFTAGAGPGGPGVLLDTEMTPELKEEGMLRDFVRLIQEWRKQQGLSIADRPGLRIKTNLDFDFYKKYKDILMTQTNLSKLEVVEVEIPKEIRELHPDAMTRQYERIDEDA